MERRRPAAGEPLVYLLDHEYTQRGLSWDRLKGADAERAALLRAAAEDAGCEAVLALTEIKETWDTEPARRGRGVDLTYIITSELTLNWWTGVPGGEPISLYVPDEQVCASTPSADLKPCDSEYTGYMGNYGNTMDRWYRRAAVVVWPRQHAFAARAEASPSWALTELRARLDAGDLVNARAAAESVAPFWKAPGPKLLEPALTTAARLEAPGIALMLLRPFAVEWLTPAHAGGLAALATRYGESWHRNLLDAWFGSRNTWRYTGDVDHQGWDAALPGLTAALRDAGAAATAGWLLAASWGWLDDEIRLWLRYPSAAIRRKQLAELGKPLAGLLAAADGTALVGAIVTVLREHGDNVLGCLLPMLRAAGPGPSAPLYELARDCERRPSSRQGSAWLRCPMVLQRSSVPAACRIVIPHCARLCASARTCRCTGSQSLRRLLAAVREVLVALACPQKASAWSGRASGRPAGPRNRCHQPSREDAALTGRARAATELMRGCR